MARNHEATNGIACPKCGCANTDIIRTKRREAYLERRRECCACKHRFNTAEGRIVCGAAETAGGTAAV